MNNAAEASDTIRATCRPATRVNPAIAYANTADQTIPAAKNPGELPDRFPAISECRNDASPDCREPQNAARGRKRQSRTHSNEGCRSPRRRRFTGAQRFRMERFTDRLPRQVQQHNRSGQP
jgi:hypothetical protein